MCTFRTDVFLFSEDLSGYLAPVVYYRLRLVDLDESFSLSRVIAWHHKNQFASMGVYPNPVHSSGKVNIDTSLPDFQVSLLDMLGRKIVLPSAKLINGKAELDLAGVTSGFYIMQLRSASGTVSTKLVIN